jgi:hypothetical protein
MKELVKQLWFAGFNVDIIEIIAGAFASLANTPAWRPGVEHLSGRAARRHGKLTAASRGCATGGCKNAVSAKCSHRMCGACCPGRGALANVWCAKHH